MNTWTTGVTGEGQAVGISGGGKLYFERAAWSAATTEGSKDQATLFRGLESWLGGVMSDGSEIYRFRTTVSSTSPPQALWNVLCDLPANLDWSGERAPDQTYRLLSLDSSDRTARVETTFISTGANFNGTFHDSSIVTELDPPRVFAYETEARLERKRGPTWEAHFAHRYEISPRVEGSQIVYTGVIERANYVPYWLRWWMAPIFKPATARADKKQLSNLARLAEERWNS